MTRLKFFGLCLLAVVMSQSSFAAIKISVDEILSMPPGNRLGVAEKQANDRIYDELVQVAFDKKENYQKRWSALTLASQVKGPLSIKTLEKAAIADEWFMRNAALISMQKVSASKAKEMAIKFLQDESLVVRSAAVLALPETLKVKERERLWQELSAKYNFRGRQSLWIRAQILNQLAKMPEKSETILFVKHLNDLDSRLATPAIAALEKLNSATRTSKNENIEAKKKTWLQWARNQGIAIR